MPSPFERKISIRIPFSDKSAGNPFDIVAAGLPLMGNGKPIDSTTFGFVNETPWDVRLQGFSEGQTFAPVKQDGNSWSILARTEKGIFLSKKPLLISVQAFSTSGNPIPTNTDFSNCYLELVYGKGA